MQSISPKRATFAGLALLLAGALPLWAQPPTAVPTPLPASGKAPKTAIVSVAQYRAQRVKARDRLAALAARSGGGARDASLILQALDKPQIVRRADGATQAADGNRWSALASGVSPIGSGDAFDIKSLQRGEIKRLARDLESEIAELDRWNATEKGAYYQPVDAGAIVAQLEKSGQIRVGPTWWQSTVQAIKKWFFDGVGNFFKWIGGFLPSFAPAANVGGGLGAGFLIFAFWAIVLVLLTFLLISAYRIFGANVRWGGRRKKKSDEEVLQGEDAELLLLPPDELSARAAAFAVAGNFREALRHRYIALLLRLDSRGVWRYDTRRTNWEHIAALRRGTGIGNAIDGNSEIVAPLSDLTRRFDRVRYGSASCDGADWERFERDANALETRAAPTREMAGAAGGLR